MFQAISTKYLGPTNHRGSRVKATCQRGSMIVSWDYGLNPARNHQAAAQAMAEKYNWTGNWTGGATKDGFVFVCDSRDGFTVPSQ